MPPKTPVVLAKKEKGLLPVDPQQVNHTHAHAHAHAHAHGHGHGHGHANRNNHQPKNSARLKLQIRRLPPALTEKEFLEAFGDEWEAPGDKVDWIQYRPGKTKGPGKLSLQSRAYVHLSSETHIKPFEAKFLSITFQDAKGSHKDAHLKHLLPTLAFAPNQRIPSAKKRVDGRQGTIDQDPEFIAFLERETQPVTKPMSLDQAQAQAQDKPKEKTTSTPLLDDLREKKQNKAKAQKHKEEKAHDKSASRSRSDKQDGKQPVKVLAKNQKSQPAQSPAAAAAASAQPSPASARKRERAAPNNQIKSMLQRDLGLNPPSKRGGKDSAAATPNKNASPAPAAAATAAQTTPATASPAKPAKSRARNKDKANAQPAATSAQENSKPTPPAPTGILKKPAQQSTPKTPKAKNNNATAAANAAPSPSPSPAPAKPPKAAPQPAPGSTKAYLKHANASQGVTEPLLHAALSVFGPVVKVDIDKRKGTALAEFKDTDGLKAAMAKKNIPVAQGAVEVLEFREKPAPGGGRNAQPRGPAQPGRGRGRGARGGGAAAANATATATATNGNAGAGPATAAPAKPDAT